MEIPIILCALLALQLLSCFGIFTLPLPGFGRISPASSLNWLVVAVNGAILVSALINDAPLSTAVFLGVLFSLSVAIPVLMTTRLGPKLLSPLLEVIPSNRNRLREYDGLLWNQHLWSKSYWFAVPVDKREPELGLAFDEPMPWGQKPYRKRSEESLALDAVSTETWVRRRTAKSPYAPIELLEMLAVDPEQAVREGVAMNQRAPVHVLERLAADEHVGVRGWVARNPNSDSSTLNRFSTDGNETIRLFLSRNTRIPVESAIALAVDESEDVRFSLAQNRNTPLEGLERLAEGLGGVRYLLSKNEAARTIEFKGRGKK